MKKLSPFIFLTLLFSSLCDAQSLTERILDFKSAITVFADATMHVHETIAVALPAGRHGIMREFPTSYADRWGVKHIVSFNVESVMQDGKPAQYKVQMLENGKRIVIGDPHKTLTFGVHVYDIVYTTHRQLGFFENHDELYWNVTGNGWRLPIDHASATVTLPDAIAPNQMRVEAYTGYQGQQGKNYLAAISGPSTAQWHTIEPLAPHEGLTLVITLPKGIVIPPSLLKKIGYFIRDNGALFLLLLGLFTLLGYCLMALRSIWKEQRAGTIIPLFYPPQDLQPAYIRHLMEYGFDNKAFAAEIINMAVHGFITIESKQNFLSRTYILKKTGDGDESLREAYKPLLASLFGSSDTLKLNSDNQSYMSQTMELLKHAVSKAMNQYFEYYGHILGYGIIIACVFSFAAFLVGFEGQGQLFFGFAALFALILFGFAYAIKGYTQAGRKLRDEIEGFKLFLKTTEEERLKIIGTPPTRTPELYEKYLPYAVALGVEKQWSDQFAPVFAQMARAGAPYVPIWYIGNGRDFSGKNFGSNLSNSLSSAIASSTKVSSSGTPPGSSSGSGGGGSSGGGGGGGGGGTW